MFIRDIIFNIVISISLKRFMLARNLSFLLMINIFICFIAIFYLSINISFNREFNFLFNFKVSTNQCESIKIILARISGIIKSRYSRNKIIKTIPLKNFFFLKRRTTKYGFSTNNIYIGDFILKICASFFKWV